ncbi:MAG: hypothetical protein RQ982_10170 [Gammaproteobacteria bacterium]|nr:hypothetical protein [Gammaproteobacteria bacterium]
MKKLKNKFPLDFSKEKNKGKVAAALNTEALKLVRWTLLAERPGRERMFRTVEQAVAAYEARGPQG